MAKRSAKCPHCGNRVEVDSEAGGHVVCPQCQAHLTVNIHKTGERDHTKKPAAPADPLIGKTLGELEIVDLLGRGGMGAVYKARQPSLDRMVAVKVLSKDHSRDTAYVGRFAREARAAAAVNHPNIIEIHSVGEDRGHQYIAMELVEGETLGDVLRRDGPVPPDRAVEIMKQVAAALAEAHDAGIVHRDIKPSNILLTPRGGVKVADFGLAKRPHVDVAVTQAGKILGTPLYMPPEVASGEEFEPRSDLYSLGATFYHALAGRPPFEGGTSSQIAVKQVQEQVPPLARIAPDVPQILAGLIHRLLSKAPADRPATAAAVLEALKYIDADMAAARSPSGLGTALPPDQRRVLRKIPTAKKANRSTLLIPGIIAAAVLAIGVGIVLIFALGGDDPQPKEGKPPSVVKPPPQPPPAWHKAWRTARGEADRLLETLRFGEALAVHEKLGKRYGHAQLQQHIQQARTEILDEAKSAWDPIRDRAKALRDSGKRTEAEAVLQPVIAVWGIQQYGDEARTILAQALPPPPAPKDRMWEKPLRETKKKADDLAKQQRFGEAIKAYQDLGKQYKDQKLQDHVTKAIAAIEKSAETAWLAVDRNARNLLGQKKYKQALAALKPPLETYGIDPLKKKAETLRARIIAAQAEDALAAAERAAYACVANLDLKGAASALGKVPSASLPNDLAARLTTRRDEIARLARLKARIIENITKLKPWLSKGTAVVPGSGGKKFKDVGEQIASADEKGVTLHEVKAVGEKTRRQTWAELDDAVVGKLLALALSAKSGDDQLAAGLLALSRKDTATAEKHFEKARTLGVKIDRYLDPLAAGAFGRATALLDAGKFPEADAALEALAKKYGQTPWFASHKDDVKAARDEAVAEMLYAQAAASFKRQRLFDLKPIIQKLKGDYPNTKPVTDATRKPAFGEMAKAVKNLGKFLTVRQDGKGDFKIIQPAINIAPPNSVIEIQDSGRYEEKLVIARGKDHVTLRGREGQWPLVFSVTGGHVLSVDSEGIGVERMIILNYVPPNGRVANRCGVRLGWKAPGRLRLRWVLVYAPSRDINSWINIGKAEIDDSLLLGSLLCTHRAQLAVRGSIVTGGIRDAGQISVQRSTVIGGIRADTDPPVVLDSIVASIDAAKAGTRADHCAVFRGGFLRKARPGKGCTTRDPQFRDPSNLDYRLKKTKTNPCRGKASDRGDVGCRYTPEMIEIVKKALELRKKGIIKF